jgi:hypothetical protein
VPSDMFDVMWGVEILDVIIKVYVMSDIHGIKELICDKNR